MIHPVFRRFFKPVKVAECVSEFARISVVRPLSERFSSGERQKKIREPKKNSLGVA